MEFHFALLIVTVATNRTPSNPQYVEILKGLKRWHIYLIYHTCQLSLRPVAFSLAFGHLCYCIMNLHLASHSIFGPVPNKKQFKRPSTFFMKICKLWTSTSTPLLKIFLNTPTFSTHLVSWWVVKSEEVSTNFASSLSRN